LDKVNITSSQKAFDAIDFVANNYKQYIDNPGFIIAANALEKVAGHLNETNFGSAQSAFNFIDFVARNNGLYKDDNPGFKNAADELEKYVLYHDGKFINEVSKFTTSLEKGLSAGSSAERLRLLEVKGSNP